jgi:tetratricopeptide (TPR) repeat protein
MPWCLSPRALVLYIFLLSTFGSAQTAPPSAPVEKPAPAGPATSASNSPASSSPVAADSAQESVVVDQNLMKVAFEDDGTGIREQTVAIHVQSQAGVQALGVLSFPYLSSSDRIEFDYIRVRKPDGTVVNTPDYNVQDMPAEVTRAAPMYSDIHEKHVTIKGLGVGDILEYKVRYSTFKPQVPGQFWWEYSFDKILICRDCQLQLTVPKDKHLKLLSPDYKPETKEDGSHRVYLWKTSNLKSKDTSEPVSREAKKPDVQLSTFRSWQEIGAWYNELQKPQLTVTPQIQTKVAELTKGFSSDEDKARAIYNYVATRFHYVSLSFGVGRYQPHPAEDVLENEYGDCKDKHTLLATMLKTAGIVAWPALINSDRELDPDMPSPGQFNHVITYLPHNGNPIWLDTTPEVAPFGMLIASLRDKRALVIPNDKPAELKTTPANPPFPANQTFTIEGAIDSEGTLKAHVKQAVRGDQEVLVRLGFRATAQAQWKDLVQRISNGQGFGGEVSDVSASAPDDTSKPFEFSYDYTRKNYSDWDNHRMIAPLPFTGLEGAAVQEKKPVDPVLLGGLGELIYTANIKLPVAVEKLPPDVSLKEPYADFESKYSHVGDVLLVKRKLEIKQNEVPLASWDNYKKFSKALSDDWGGYTELYAAAKKQDADNNAASAASSDDERHELWQQAWDALQRNDTTTAEDILRQALKKYPDGVALHGTLGEVYARRNDTQPAIDEFRKEEELHPENAAIYQVFAFYAQYLERDDIAADQFRKWIEHDPKNFDAYSGLSSILYKQKKYPEVLTLWLQASQQMPENQHVRASLGYAHLINKQPDKAMPYLEQAMASDPKPMMLNSVAYSLAEQNASLEKAREWVEKAISDLYKESLTSNADDAALSNTAQLAATWDTAGWVYYKAGDLTKAEAYLRAAFDLSQVAVEGDHLAQTYQKLGKKQQAEHTYRLAYAQAKEPLKDEIKKRYQQLMGKDADPEDAPVHLKRGAPNNDFGAEDELSKIRTTKLSTKEATNSSATFTVVFAPDKIEAVKFVSGDERLKPMASQIANSKVRADFPDATPARLTRRGVLMCGSTGCDFTLLLPSAVYATASKP